MNKQEFLEKQAVLTEKMIAIKEESLELDRAYILANAEFSVGQKVCLSEEGKNKRFAFIKRVIVDWGGDIDYEVYEAKKDGTPSQFLDFIGYGFQITTI